MFSRERGLGAPKMVWNFLPDVISGYAHACHDLNPSYQPQSLAAVNSVIILLLLWVIYERTLALKQHSGEYTWRTNAVYSFVKCSTCFPRIPLADDKLPSHSLSPTWVSACSSLSLGHRTRGRGGSLLAHSSETRDRN